MGIVPILCQRLAQWFAERKLQYCLTGSEQSGDGYTNGVSNRHTAYMAYNANETDGVVFKIMFPDCKVHISKQHDYD
jgi:hypothetical protein